MIHIPQEQVDILASFLAELTGTGVEESLAQPGSHSSNTALTCYLDNDDSAPGNREKIECFLKKICQDAPAVLYEEIVEEDWGKNWKKEYKPTRVSERIIIKPTWEEYEALNNEIVIEIDPGLAFGTGLHASTRLALQLIETAFTVDPFPEKVLDVGTGTGILAMAAALLGAPEIMAIDNDPDAVVCATANIEQNGLTHMVTASNKNLDKVKGPFDLVVANITADVLSLLAPQLAKLTSDSGQLILAGILKGDQAAGIERIFTDLDFTLCNSPMEDEWQAFLFSRK